MDTLGSICKRQHPPAGGIHRNTLLWHGTVVRSWRGPEYRSCGIRYRNHLWPRPRLGWIPALAQVDWGASSGLDASPCVAWAIVQTGSRGGVLALASGAVVFALAQSSVRRKAGGVLLVVLIFATLLGFSERSEMVTTRWERTLEAGDTSERWEIQLEAAQLFLERPFLGWGPSNNYDELGMRLGETGARGTHNQMLALLTQVGLLGTVPYAMALLLCLRGALRAVKGRLGPAPLALVTVVAVVSLSLDWQNRKLYWLVLALALASQVSSLQGMSGSTAAAFRRRRRRLPTPLPGEPN